MKALPDEEGIETVTKAVYASCGKGMKALPDEEGIETFRPPDDFPNVRMKALPDEEGIETGLQWCTSHNKRV